MVEALVFSQKGKQISSASSDGTVPFSTLATEAAEAENSTAFKPVMSISSVEEHHGSRYETDRVEPVDCYLATQVQPLHNRLRPTRNDEGLRKALLSRRRSNRRKQTPMARAIEREKKMPMTSCFWQAAKKGDLGMIKHLIDKGIDNDIAVYHSVSGVTPLHWAARNGSLEMAKILLESGADSNACDKDGCSVLICAASSGNLQMVEHLLKLGVNADGADHDGSTALSVAAEKGHEAVVQFMLQNYNCDPNKPDKDGGTPTSWAAWSGHLRTVQVLANHGAVSNWVDQRWGRTPLSWAAENGHWEVMEFLIVQEHIEPDSIASEGDRTPLSYASEKGHNRAVTGLLATGAVNVLKADYTGKTSLDYAKISKRKDVVCKLQQYLNRLFEKSGDVIIP